MSQKLDFEMQTPETAAAEVENRLEQLRAKADTRKKEVRAATTRVKATVGGAPRRSRRRFVQVAESLKGSKEQIASLRAELSGEAAKVKAAVTVTTAPASLVCC